MSKAVCMAVLHYQGRFYRAYKGRRAHNHVLDFEETYTPPDDRALEFEIPPTIVYPDHVVIKLDGHQLFAGHGKFYLMAGRRYPGVIHWFLVTERRAPY